MHHQFYKNLLKILIFLYLFIISVCNENIISICENEAYSLSYSTCLAEWHKSNREPLKYTLYQAWVIYKNGTVNAKCKSRNIGCTSARYNTVTRTRAMSCTIREENTPKHSDNVAFMSIQAQVHFRH